MNADETSPERTVRPSGEARPDALPDPRLAPDPDLPNADLQVDDPTRGGHD